MKAHIPLSSCWVSHVVTLSIFASATRGSVIHNLALISNPTLVGATPGSVASGSSPIPYSPIGTNPPSPTNPFFNYVVVPVRPNCDVVRIQRTIESHATGEVKVVHTLNHPEFHGILFWDFTASAAAAEVISQAIGSDVSS